DPRAVCRTALPVRAFSARDRDGGIARPRHREGGGVMNPELHGLVASFATPDEFLAALRRVRREGYSAIEVNVPFAVEGMDEWLPGRPTPIARIVLAGALVGASGGYFLQWFAARDYPLNV